MLQYCDCSVSSLMVSCIWQFVSTDAYRSLSAKLFSNLIMTTVFMCCPVVAIIQMVLVTKQISIDIYYSYCINFSRMCMLYKRLRPTLRKHDITCFTSYRHRPHTSAGPTTYSSSDQRRSRLRYYIIMFICYKHLITYSTVRTLSTKIDCT